MSSPHDPGGSVEFARTLRQFNVTTHRLAHAFSAANGLHTTDFRALGFIYEAEQFGSPLSATELARRLNLSSAAITYLVERLVGTGHVLRDSDPRDRRRGILRHAPEGQRVASAYFGPLRDHLAQMLTNHTAEEIATATEILKGAVAVMQDYEHQLTTTDEPASPSSPPAA